MKAWPYLALSGMLLSLASPAPASAQVGHAPAESPYRDIPRGSAWSLMVGHLGGDGGELEIGPHNGMTYGVRWDLRMSGFIGGGLGISYMDLERFIVDADDPVDDRKSGPVDQSVVEIEAHLQFTLTGTKTWHGLAPYVTGGLAYAFGSSTAQDTSGYEFGNRVAISPGLGARYFLGRHTHLRVEARRHFWRLKYPLAYTQEPDDDPGTEEDPHAVLPDGGRDDWASGWWLLAGFAFSF